MAAMELIAENGFHGSPTAMIASRAGVGTGTIYRYFADKEALIKAVFAAIESRLQETVMANYPADQSIRRRLDHYLTGLVRFFIDNPLEFKFLGQFYDSPFGVALRRDKIFGQSSDDGRCHTMRGLFEQGVAERQIKDLPIPVLFGLSIGSLISVTRDHILGFVSLDTALIRQIVDACWDAVKCEQSAPGSAGIGHNLTAKS